VSPKAAQIERKTARESDNNGGGTREELDKKATTNREAPPASIS
jgi:hypothetical protein